jgi:hypothetical protein
MSLSMILAAIGGLIALIAGIFIGKPIGKSQGVREGAQQVQQQQEIIQARETVQAVQERAHVEAEVAVSDDDDLDRELSRHSRPD